MSFHGSSIICVFVLVGVAVGKNQVAVLYDQYSSAGGSISISGTYVPDLNAVSFDNRAFSVCTTGVWIFYDQPNYNPDGNGRVEYVFGQDNHCSNLRTTGGSISSVKFAGHPDDFSIESLTLYQYDYFQGKEEYTFVELENLDTLQAGHKSIIITGQSNWTVFDQPDFTGNSICLQVPVNENNSPSFITDIQKDAGSLIPHGTIKSVRKGCIDYGVRSVTMTAFGSKGILLGN